MIAAGRGWRAAAATTARLTLLALSTAFALGCDSPPRTELPALRPAAAELPAPELAGFVSQKHLLNAGVLNEAAQAAEGEDAYGGVLSVWQGYYESMAELVAASVPADHQRYRVAQAASPWVVRFDTLIELGEVNSAAGVRAEPASPEGGLELASAMWHRVDREGSVQAGPARLQELLRQPLPPGTSLRTADELKIPSAEIGVLEITASGTDACRAQVGWASGRSGRIYHWRALIPKEGPLAFDLVGNHGLPGSQRLNYVFLRHDGCSELSIGSLRVLLRSERFAGESFGVAQVPLRNDLRRAVHQSVGSELAFRVRVPQDGPTFHTSLGSLPGTTGVSFQVELDDGERTLLLDEAPSPGQWHDLQIDLARWAGREVGLRFRVDLAASAVEESGATGGDVGFWANPVVRAREIPLPDVVWYLIDCLRADHMGLYGYPLATTPKMDAFFAEGAVFEHAYTNGNNTRSSVATAFTGLTPSAVGTDEPWGRVDDVHLTVTEVLRELGYRTIGVVTNSNGGGPAGLDQGYSELLEFDWLLALHGGKLLDGKPRFGPKVLRAIEQHLKATSDVPIFLYIHTLDLHDPYRPPDGYLERFPAQDYAEAKRLWELDEEGVLRARSYDAELRYSDDVFRDITGVLERTLRWGDAIVWLMADHGEYLGEKGMWYHDPWFPPQDAVLRIPLAVVQRGRVSATRVEEPAQLLDVGDTTLGLLGGREAVRPWSLGRDLVPLIEGESWPARRPIVSENQASKSGDRTEAFQLHPYTFRSTPRGEWVTSAERGVPRPVPTAFGGVLEAYRGLSEIFEAHASGQEPEVISPGEIDQLRALGYIE